MNISIPYRDGIETIELRDANLEQVVCPRAVSPRDEIEVLKRAISNPMHSPSLEDFIESRRKILLVVNDATRPTPTSRVLNVIYPLLKDRDFKIIIATGSHRAPVGEEYDFIFGKFYSKLRDRNFVHDARESEFFTLGKTRYGNKIRLNRLVQRSDTVIPIGSIEPHYFAGYTGGRKSFMPGLADYDCITANHKLAISQAAAATVLEGNPVANELEDAEELLRKKIPLFAIMTVLDAEHRIYDAASGDICASFRILTEKADEIFVVPVKNRADIVVTVAAAPTDIDLYQSHKALENGRHALKEGGIMILVSACRRGIGPRAFIDLLAAGESCQAVIDKLSREYKLGYHKAGKMAQIGLHGKMWAVTPLDKALITKAHMRPFDHVSEALAEAFREKGPDARVTVIMDGGLVMPKLDSQAKS